MTDANLPGEQPGGEQPGGEQSASSPPPPPPVPPVPAAPLAPAAPMAPAAGTTMLSDPNYPVRAGLDAPLEVARWRVIGNPVLAIPHLVVLYVLEIVASILVLVAWFAILFTGRMPASLGDFVAGVHRYQWRVGSYLLFLREPYPKFAIPSGYSDPGGDVASLQIDAPARYSRLAVLFRVILVIPQALIGIVWSIGLYVAWIIGFFAVLFTGRWPEGLRRFVVGVEYWYIRVNAWYQLLADPYPPFGIV